MVESCGGGLSSEASVCVDWVLETCCEVVVVEVATVRVKLFDFACVRACLYRSRAFPVRFVWRLFMVAVDISDPELELKSSEML